MKNPPLAEIIVPVYNAAGFLEACLDSILAQTEPNWRAILVDDGSTDDSAAICQRYVSRDERFTLIRQPNQGVSAARNTGIRAACAPYLLFTDADDQLSPVLLSAALEAQRQHPHSVVFWSFRDSLDALDLQPPLNPAAPCPSSSLAALHMSGVLCPVYTKLYDRALLWEEEIRFETGKSLGEDMMFNLDYLRACQRRQPDFTLLNLDKAYYFYNPGNPSSLTHSLPPDYCDREIELFQRLISVCRDSFHCPQQQLDRIDLQYFETLADWVAALPAEEGRRALTSYRRLPDIQALLARLGQAGAYSPFLVPFSGCRYRQLVFLYRLRIRRPRWFQRLFWLGYRLRTLRGKAPELYVSP